MIAWKENRKGGCKLNHNGSAPAMEQKHFFERAARYTEYYGDGDNKAYSEEQNMQRSSQI